MANANIKIKLSVRMATHIIMYTIEHNTQYEMYISIFILKSRVHCKPVVSMQICAENATQYSQFKIIIINSTRVHFKK